MRIRQLIGCEHDEAKKQSIMVSDFVDEHNGFLAPSDVEHDVAKALNPQLQNTHVNSQNM